MLQVQGLAVRYGTRQVLDSIDIAALPAGSLTALLGPNGSGKSTLLKALAGLQPAQARLLLDGEDVQRWPRVRRGQQLVYMPQALPRAVRLSVFEALLIAAHTGRSGPSDRARQAARLLQQLGIAALAERRLDELSGGQLQLVGLAQALIRQPRVLLLDEPLSALDLNHQFHVMQRLRSETQAHGLITLVVLHDLDTALRHADQALMLHQGRVLAQGLPSEVIEPDTLARAYGVQARIVGGELGHPHVHIDGLIQPP
ncbi:ABC transporter ATP-binding protein [Bordetella trematum]|uniref:ABC transporter ATP-binding protein n=1 Tax=Bordetella trematum TaxID=123899 RepID=UPI000D843C0B|nr:ABC transporter ATP-binding protein [Bordetella trematum]SPU51443.1 ABC transporter ATP-binding protein [Bordetella trematum]VDH08637.1 Iron(3+)-hydroxamate import ATP-binding protein FhuC [Bordetella trematum]